MADFTDRPIDATLDFWEFYPEFKSIKPFKEFYRGNDKKESGLLMWFLSYIYRLESPFYGMQFNRRVKEVGGSILGDRNYYKNKKKEVDFLGAAFVKCVDSAGDRQLREWDAMMDSRSEFMADQKYDEDNFEMLDKMGEKTEKLYASFERIRKVREVEKSGVKKGGGLPSESDTGKL